MLSRFFLHFNYSPTYGDILIDGSSIIENDFDLSQIGILIEDPGYYPHLSGLDNLMMLYTINHKPDKNYIMKVLAGVNLAYAANKKYKEYSLGMKQRLRVAQAFMENQKLIILDEPTNGIDEEGLEIVYSLIHEAKKDGKLVLLASHNKDDLKNLCDQVFKIEHGRIVDTIEMSDNR
ncbi:ATP-binding cassette domain-containing protein [uncultured Thomasclavelia sp.]|uniref:ATP-binding cassette domain-containing protein n=1 Tax=uncultured Thomasclavelia sp. TaxID=3025759 RepID=UPI0025E839F3|nr:ATP-binding cassette domain-containing protein [uncultured Thomasclavelia sp.]